jgi:tRNA(fMet)-specific endonuclease VapC
MRYLVDTSVASFAIREQRNVTPRLASCRCADLAISSVALAEGFFGCARLGPSGLRKWAVWQALIADWHVLSFDRACAERYARLRADLERRGCVIGDRDMMIAATALAHGLVLVTDNDAEFSRIPGLRVENWCTD